jgi:electron transport complex protein RnfE
VPANIRSTRRCVQRSHGATLITRPKCIHRLTNGIIKENPVLRLVLGTCPTLAVTTMASNGLGMGIAATVVLLGSNVAISLLRKIIPDKVRIPAYITIIAGFVTIVQMIVKAFAPDLDAALGIFLPLIVVNCIIFGRAEMFANKNPVLASVLDAIGMGIGFTATLVIMGGIRELIGAGSFFGMPVTKGAIEPMLIMILPPGGFFIYGIMIALANKISGKEAKLDGCAACGAAEFCHATRETKKAEVKGGVE